MTDSSYAELVAERILGLRSELVEAGHGAVNIIGVTKGQGTRRPADGQTGSLAGVGEAAPLAALAAGLCDLGENYAQELVAKFPAVARAWAERQPRPHDPPEVRWHFIGQLQRRKVKAVAEYVALWQSVDRDGLIAEIARRAPGAELLLQINLSGAEGRGGCRPSEAEKLLSVATSLGLSVRGLMGVASNAEPERVESEFTSLVRLADSLGLPERCIGMSGDYRIAMDCGSTMIRIGQRIFGERARPQ